MHALLVQEARCQYTAKYSAKSRQARARPWLVVASAVAVAAAFCPVAHAEVKKVAYPEVKVTIDNAYKPDAAFDQMRAAFARAVKKKDPDALSKLVAPTFLWTIGGEPAEKMDLGRDAVHNFKVVFGFRAQGKDVDGGVSDGPYWETLASFADDATYYATSDTGDLICGPIAAEAASDEVFEQARKKVETGDTGADWYFTLAGTDVAKAPGDAGAPVAKIGTIALPVLSTFPTATKDQPEPQPTHFEVLLPSGKSGWIPAAAARPLYAEHLCYAKTPDGKWKIASFNEPSQ